MVGFQIPTVFKWCRQFCTLFCLFILHTFLHISSWTFLSKHFRTLFPCLKPKRVFLQFLKPVLFYLYLPGVMQLFFLACCFKIYQCLASCFMPPPEGLFISYVTQLGWEGVEEVLPQGIRLKT